MTNSLPVEADTRKNRQWQDETIYSIMIDRFHNGDQTNDMGVNIEDPAARHGGDFLGIIDKLDYIKEMGFTSILLSPVFDHGDRDYQGFGVTDFYQIDEHFGTIDDFKRLVDEAHKRDLKVMIDFVVSYAGKGHPWLSDSNKKKWLETPERQENSQDYVKINLENQQASQYIMDAAKWWIEETEIDGYRLYSVDEVPVRFLADFSKEVKSIKDPFYLLGELKDDDSEKRASFLEAGLDGFTDYSLSNELRKVFHKPDYPFTELFSLIEKNLKLYENSNLLATFMDNGQVSRFTRDMIEINEHPGPRWRQALTFLYTTPGIPIVFYGSEIALDGGEPPDNVQQMNFRTDPELVEYIIKIGDLRAALPSLSRGSLEVLVERDGFAIFKREYENETSVVAINNTSKTQSATIPAEVLADNMELKGMLNGDLVRSQNSEYVITIDRDESEIYLLKEKSGLNIAYLLALAVVLFSFGTFLYLVWRKSRKQQG